jgi:hypothetical protein
MSPTCTHKQDLNLPYPPKGWAYRPCPLCGCYGFNGVEPSIAAFLILEWQWDGTEFRTKAPAEETFYRSQRAFGIPDGITFDAFMRNAKRELPDGMTVYLMLYWEDGALAGQGSVKTDDLPPPLWDYVSITPRQKPEAP